MWIVVENIRWHLAGICCQLWLLVFMELISLISVCIIQVFWDLLQLIRCSSTGSSLALVFLQTICLCIVGSTLDSYSNNVRWCKTMVVSPLTEAKAEIFWMPIARARDTGESPDNWGSRSQLKNRLGEIKVLRFCDWWSSRSLEEFKRSSNWPSSK